MWIKFCDTFEEVSETPFFRKSFDAGEPLKLFLFADASEEAYGCSIYAVQGAYRALIFAKTKVSPIKERTLPSLELLAAQLALKCFSTIFESSLVNCTKFERITFYR